MRKFFNKIIFASLPVLLLLIIYVCTDPFKVIYKYQSYFKSGSPAHITLNKDFVSTQTFINNSARWNYNAFIFGNSRSIFYQVNAWKKYIKTDNCFHFDASGESLLGIEKKIRFLNKKEIKISHALIIIDNTTLSKTTETESHLTLSHPCLSNDNWITFQFMYIKTYFTPKFLTAYLDFLYSKRVREYMKEGSLLSENPINYKLKYNEISFDFFEKTIKSHPTRFYTEQKMKSFYKRDSIQRFSERVIYRKQYNMLLEISHILRVNKTAYKIIINPLYDQKKLNSFDIKVLGNIFGKSNVYDFSGINFITKDYHNYYEDSHYRPHVASYIMKEIYR